jgi:hypothetical protein
MLVEPLQHLGLPLRKVFVAGSLIDNASEVPLLSIQAVSKCRRRSGALIAAAKETDNLVFRHGLRRLA